MRKHGGSQRSWSCVISSPPATAAVAPLEPEPTDRALLATLIAVIPKARRQALHGGPELQARQGFDPVVEALAAAGHTVLVPNVRGSTGYGKRWYAADDKRRRMDAVADLAALHAYLPKLGLDQSRAALWGGSYGGYMVLAGLAFQPGLWAADVDIAGIASLVTFLENTSAYRRAYRGRRRSSAMVRAAVPEPCSSGWPTPRDRAGGHRRPVLRLAHGAWPGPGLRAWCWH